MSTAGEEAGDTRSHQDATRSALRQYDLPVAAVQLLNQGFNAIFRVDTTDGRAFALRVHALGHRTPVEIRSELWWLRRLLRDTDLGVPQPIPNRDEDDLTMTSMPGVAGGQPSVLFSWVAGERVQGAPTPDLALQLGGVLATLHAHAETLVPPSGFSTTRMDQVWEFGPPPEIYGDQPDALFTAERRAVLRESARQVRRALDALYADPRELRFIHADLHLGNVKLDRGVLKPLDFDDCL